jgi:hypothetical protein
MKTSQISTKITIIKIRITTFNIIISNNISTKTTILDKIITNHFTNKTENFLFIISKSKNNLHNMAVKPNLKQQLIRKIKIINRNKSLKRQSTKIQINSSSFNNRIYLIRNLIIIIINEIQMMKLWIPLIRI